MEPHSRPCSSHNGTLRLLQAVVLLLKSAFAGPTSNLNSVTQTDTSPALCQNIRDFAYRLLFFINPFVISDDWLTAFVGMVKLTAICGVGSALWLRSKQIREEKAVSSPVDTQHAEASGKNTPAIFGVVSESRGPTRMEIGPPPLWT